MEILIGALIAIATQLLKKITNKIGKEMTLLAVFILVLIGTFAYQYASIHLDAVLLKNITVTFFSAIGFYELILKRLPFIGRIEK